MLGDQTFRTPDGVLSAIAIVACLSTISHSQKNLLLSYVTTCVYSLIRTFFWLGRTDLFRFFKFNITVLLAFTMIYMFSRSVHQI